MPPAARHRRPLLVPLFVAAATVAALAAAAPAQAASVDQTKPLTAITSGLAQYRLQASAVGADLGNYDAAMPVVSLNTVLADTTTAKTMVGGSASSSCVNGNPALPQQPAASMRNTWCWSAADENDSSWQPQGLTTSYDFDGGDAMEGPYRVLISGWTGSISGANAGDGKLQIVDYSSNPPTYHTVYLAEANADGTNIAQIASHLGGLAWVGGHLFATAEKRADNADQTALYDFDFSNLRKLTTTAPPSSCSTITFGKGCDGKYRAHGYPYIMLVTRRYVWDTASSTTHRDCTADVTVASRGFCFDSLTLDKSTTPPSIVGSEYVSDNPSASCSSSPTLPSCAGMRILRYSLGGPDSGLAVDGSGVATPSAGYLTHVINIQGISAYGGHIRLVRSGSRGGLWGASVGATTTTSCGSTGATECWAGLSPNSSAEEISDDRVNGLLWGQTECGGQTVSPYHCTGTTDKVVFAVADSAAP